MRSRSASVYAKQSPLKAPETQSTITPAPKPVAKLSQADVSKLFEDFGPLYESTSFKDSFSGDFSQCSSSPSDNFESTASNSLNTVRSRGASGHSCESIFGDDIKSVKMVRGMVIGSQEVDRLQLVNNLYSADHQDAPAVGQQKFDLVTRKVEKETVTEKYQFWIKETGSERKHAALYNVYYKTSSVFFLVYNKEDRATFECLEHEIQLIKEANKNKEVLFVLFANQGADNNCQVSQEEVKEMKEKYGIQMAFESNTVSEDLENLREKLSCLAK